MKVATKELVEKILLRAANREQFAVISKDRSFALTDDIILQSVAASQDGSCRSIDVFQITDSIWRDTKDGRVYAVFAEGRRYVAQPDSDGNYPDFVSKSTQPLPKKPMRILVFNIDNGEACDVYNFTLGSKIYETDPDSTQRTLDTFLSKSINMAYDIGRMKYDPEIKALCDELCVEQEESKIKVPQRIESQSVADYILSFRNGGIVEKVIPYGEKENQKDVVYFNSHPKFYIGVSATDDATPDEGDIKNANSYPSKYFEMYKRIGHRVFEGDVEDIFCELYEGTCYNLVDGLLGQKVVKVQKKVPSLLFAYTNSGDFYFMKRVEEEPIADNKAEIERTMDGMSGQVVSAVINRDPHLIVGEIIKELYNTNEHRVPGCQWAEDIKAARRRQSELESELEQEQ